MVISILGILAALTVPALKNLGKSNLNVSAARQLLDDVGRARLMAISHRTTVYMVFVPTNFWLPPLTASANWVNGLSPDLKQRVTNLSEEQLTGYTFISSGALGDQPGNHAWRYLSTWQSLPDNSLIASWKFRPRGTFTSVNGVFAVNGFSAGNAIPFPSATNAGPWPVLPFIAFNYLGQLTTNGTDPSYVDEYIPLAQGVVSHAIDAVTKQPVLQAVPASGVSESPAGNSTSSTFNLVHIDALTGRARLEFQKLPSP